MTLPMYRSNSADDTAGSVACHPVRTHPEGTGGRPEAGRETISDGQPTGRDHVTTGIWNGDRRDRRTSADSSANGGI